MMHRSIRWLLALVLVAGATPALAHPGHEAGGGLVGGIVHPFTGWDHVAAMTLVGIWAARGYARALLTLPAVFMGAMATGFLLWHLAPALPGDAVVLASLPVLLAGAVLGGRVPLRLAVVAVAVAAIGHGHAHAVEASGGRVGFAIGMLLATMVLHAGGLVLGRLLRRRAGYTAVCPPSTTIDAPVM